MSHLKLNFEQPIDSYCHGLISYYHNYHTVKTLSNRKKAAANLLESIPQSTYLTHCKKQANVSSKQQSNNYIHSYSVCRLSVRAHQNSLDKETKLFSGSLETSNTHRRRYTLHHCLLYEVNGNTSVKRCAIIMQEMMGGHTCLIMQSELACAPLGVVLLFSEINESISRYVDENTNGGCAVKLILFWMESFSVVLLELLVHNCAEVNWHRVVFFNKNYHFVLIRQIVESGLVTYHNI